VKQLDRKKTLVLNEDTLQHCTIAPCCNPISGDDVVGYITPQNQLEIHLRSCPDAVKLKTRYGNNIIACTWDTHRRRTFDCRLHISGVDSQGVLYAIADVLHKQQGFPVRRIDAGNERTVCLKASSDIAVYDTDDVRQICASLQQIENVSKAVRVELSSVRREAVVQRCGVRPASREAVALSRGVRTVLVVIYIYNKA